MLHPLSCISIFERSKPTPFQFEYSISPMQSLQPYLPYILIALVVLALLQLALYAGMNGRMKKTNRALRSALLGPSGEDLEEMLSRCLAESAQSLNRCGELETQLQSASETMRDCVQHIGLVRYDAYGDVSGSQSFSLALLDDRRNGTILTGLMGRNDGRCYAKTVVDAQTEQTLSDEENDALQMALNGGLRAFSQMPDTNRKRDKKVAR